MINEKKQLLFGFHVSSNNRYISLHIFCVLSESDATLDFSNWPGVIGKKHEIFVFLVLPTSYQMNPFIAIRRDSTAVVRDTENCVGRIS